MTFFLAENTREDIATEAPPAPSFGERFGAASVMQRIEDDSWNRKKNFEDELADQLIGVLPPDLKDRMMRPYDAYEMPSHRRSELFTVLQQAKARNPEITKAPEGDGEFAFPTTPEEFDAIVNARRQAEYDEQVAILSAAPEGSWGAEFLGRSWASLTEEKSLASLLLGAPARAGLLGTVAIEGALGGATEITMIDQRRQVAGELNVAEPNPIADVLTATALSGAFAGLIKGGAIGITRFREYRTARGRAAAEATPDGVSPMRQEAAVEETRRRLEENLPPDASDQPVAAPGTLPRLADFNFGLTGNASPQTNRVGYIFGRLLEAEIEPHIAAAFVGNGMVESGPGLLPGAVGDGGNALGVWQWNGPRRRALQDFAAKRGKPATDLDTQIAFLLHELRTSEAGAWAKIRTARTAEEAAALISQHFERPGIPHLGRRVGHAKDVMAQYQGGRIPRWTGKTPPPSADAPRFSTSRGYTRSGQVTAGDTRIDVTYEVVDASLLKRATGELQPRDRSRAASDEQIAEIAAKLDPARLMPAPEADRGAPVVGPDNVIESGNGRVMAIQRAFERHPDRAEAYRAEIEAAGYEIPEGVKEPVLVARRTSELDQAGRQRFVREANNATVARMSPTERAAADGAAMSEATLGLYTPGARLGGPENRAFAQAALGGLPQAERAAMVDATGALNAEGIRRLQAALFARAWDAPDIVARFAEADAGELRGLMDALADAAPAWAGLKADIAAGTVRADMDISPFVLDAMRLIAAAREAAQAEGKSVAGMLEELIADVDLLDGAISPLTAALVRKFWRGSRAAPKDEIAAFLTRYADEARKVGTTEAGLFGEAPGPAEVLRALDGEAFADLPDELGRPTAAPTPIADPGNLAEDAFARGADSPEAIEADQAAIEDLRGAGQTAPDLSNVAPGDYVRTLAEAQPFDDIDTLYRLAAPAQERLTRAGDEIAAGLGVEFKDPGLKDRATTERKLARKQYDAPRRLTDVSRGGFVIISIDQAEAVADALAARFDIVDEGWVRQPTGYADRKIIVRHDDGMLSEVQIWTDAMYRAKQPGTALYEEWRKLPGGDPRKANLLRDQERLYSAAAGTDFDAAKLRADGTSSDPKFRSNSASKASRVETARDVNQTSPASTSDQGAPGSSLARANNSPSSRNSTAGRPSQLQNVSSFMGKNPLQDTPNMGAISDEVNAIRADLGDLTFRLDENGPEYTAAELLDDIEADEELAEVLNLCTAGRAAA